MLRIFLILVQIGYRHAMITQQMSYNIKMGTCIGRLNRYQKSKNAQQKYLQQSQKSNSLINNSNMDLQNRSNTQLITYPYYQSILGNVHHINSINLYCGQKVSDILRKAMNQNFYPQTGTYLLNRFYSYSDFQIKKLFSHQAKFGQHSDKKYKKAFEINNKICIKVPILQGLLFNFPQSQKIKLSPQHEYIVHPMTPNYELSQQTLSSTSIVPSIYHIYQNQLGQVCMCFVRGEESIKKLHNSMRQYKKINMAKNCLINGILYCCSGDHKEPSVNGNKAIGSTFADIVQDVFNEKVDHIGRSYQIICYINPQLLQLRKTPLKVAHTLDHGSYLQLKSCIEGEPIDIAYLFNAYHILNSPKVELMCLYILLFCLKYVMFNNSQTQNIPIIFLGQLLDINIDKCFFLKKVVNVMNFFYAIAGNQIMIVSDCVRNILRIVSVNSHILLDAYLIQFGLQIDQKINPVRQNPLLKLQQPIKYRFLTTQVPNLSLINKFKILMNKNCYSLANILKLHSQGSLSYQMIQNQSSSVVLKWENQIHHIICQYFHINSLQQISIAINKRLSQTVQQNANTTTQIALQYLLYIKIMRFICLAQSTTDFFILAPSQNPPNSKDSRRIRKIWDQILQQFMNFGLFNLSSGEIAVTVLTINSLAKIMENSQNFQEIEESLEKAIQIWFRIYRDPRAKYKPFVSNSWIIYIINILIKIKRKQLVNSHSSQTIFYLQNILECFYSNGQIAQFGTPSPVQWIINNIPIRNISGIFYNKIDLLCPIKDEKSIFLMRTGSSLIQTPYDLSSKSNYSQVMSNTNSVFSKTNKKNKRKDLQIPQNSQSKALRTGVYIWGKGVSCLPLPYPFSKNLDVFKIACGNYHTVLATTIGIFGWGQNNSGQLGEASSKQSIRTIKKIYGKKINCQNDVIISCGSQHTAILMKQQNLVMFGQSQGGITSGTGHKFDSVSCGGLHTLGIRNGRVYSWGRGQGGQLGHKPEHLKTKIKQESTDFFIDQPKMINNLPYIVKSVCGDAHSVLLTSQGEVFVFGFSYQGQLGLGITGDSQVFQVFEPVKLEIKTKTNSNKVADIFAGSTFTFFKTVDGQIYSCGLNDCNQLGVQKMMRVFQKKKYLGHQKKLNQAKMGEVQFSTPNRIQIFNNQVKVNEIFCGQNHCLASVQYMKKNKMVMGWGLNKQLQISSQFSHDNVTPRTVDNIYDFKFSGFSCGSNFSLGLISCDDRRSLQQLQDNIELLLATCVRINKPLVGQQGQKIFERK